MADLAGTAAGDIVVDGNRVWSCLVVGTMIGKEVMLLIVCGEGYKMLSCSLKTWSRRMI